MSAENIIREEDVRRFIVDEVTRQLGPTHSMLNDLHEWQVGFWANGSGRPEGFFQSRVRADDLRYSRLEEETKDQSKTLETLKDYMNESKTILTERAKAEKESTERHARYWTVAKWAVGVIGPVFIALSSWTIHEAKPVLKVLWEDYLRAHPMANERLKNRSEYDPNATQRNQDVKVPSLTR